MKEYVKMTLFETGLLALFLGAVVVKPQELPGLGRRAGRLAGRAVRRLQDMKKELGEYVEKNEMRSVQEELQETMTQLNRIRQDVRSVSSVKGMMMDITAPPLISKKTWPHNDVPLVDDVKKKRNETLQGKDAGYKEEAEEEHNMPNVIPISARDLESLQNTTRESPKKQSKLVYQEEKDSASRVLLDALKEERVAKHALKFFDTQQRNTMPDKD